ncbi:hypothetical protein ACO02O_02816 [Dirofilaria immitis]
MALFFHQNYAQKRMSLRLSPKSMLWFFMMTFSVSSSSSLIKNSKKALSVVCICQFVIFTIRTIGLFAKHLPPLCVLYDELLSILNSRAVS